MRMLQTGTAALFSLAALLVAGASEAGEITVMSTVAVCIDFHNQVRELLGFCFATPAMPWPQR